MPLSYCKSQGSKAFIQNALIYCAGKSLSTYIDLPIFIMDGHLDDERLNDHFTMWMRDLLCRLVLNTL